VTLATVTNLNDLLNNINRVDPDDEIALAPGIYSDWFYPRNNTKPIRFLPANVSNLPTMRGVYIGGGSLNGGGNFIDMTLPGSGRVVSDITFEGLIWRGERFTRMKTQASIGGPGGWDAAPWRATVAPDTEGYHWRIAGTEHRNGRHPDIWDNNGRTYGLVFAGNVNRYTVKDCWFYDFMYNIQINGTTDGQISHCAFEECCEDMIRFQNYNRLRIDHNTMDNFRGLPRSLSILWGIGLDDPNPVHADWAQEVGAGGRGLIIENNVLNDDTYRVHCGLIRNAQSGGRNSNGRIINNISHTSHPTGWLIDDYDGIVVQRNKGWSYTPLEGSGAVLQVSPTTNTNVTYTNNTFTRINPNSAIGGGSGNSQSNLATTYPDGMIEVRKGFPGAVAETAGPRTDPITPPTKPTTPQAADWAWHDFVTDPGSPVGDVRVAFRIKVPTTSRMWLATEIRWTASTEGGVTRIMVNEGAIGPSGSKLWRASSNVDPAGTNPVPQLRLPGEKFDDPQVLYKLSSDGERSDLSNTAADFVVPAAPSGTWIPTRIVDLIDDTVLGFYLTDEVGDVDPDLIVGVVLGEEEIWTKPSPAFVGSAFTNTLTIANPTTPAVHAIGDYILAAIDKGVSGAYTAPVNGGGINWTTLRNINDAATAQAAMLVGGFATASPITFAPFTGSTAGRSATQAFRNVDPTNPIAAIAQSINASSVNLIFPGLPGLPVDEDNFRIVLFGLCPNGSGMVTAIPGFTRLTSAGAAPRISMWASDDTRAVWPGTTLVMGGAGFNIGLSLALRLAGTEP
jgi:hypothetical protein